MDHPAAVPSSVRRILLAAILGSTACVFPAFLLGAVAVEVRADLHFGASGIGVAVSSFFVAACVSSVAMGRYAESLGSGRSLRWAAAASAATQIGIAAFASSRATLIVLLVGGGLANALAQPAANLLIAEGLPPERQGLGFALKQSAIPAASMLAGVAVPAVALRAGWRWAFVGGAALALAAAAAPAAGFVAPPRSAEWSLTARPSSPLTATMAMLGLGIALGACAAGTLGVFLVTAGVASGLSQTAAGLALTLGSICSIAARLCGGAFADRRGLGAGDTVRVVGVMLLCGVPAYLLLGFAHGGLFVAVAPLAFAAGWGWPGLFNLAVVQAFPHATGAAIGVTQTGNYIGVVLGPLGFGLLAEHASMTVAWCAAALCAVSAAAVMFAARRRLGAESFAGAHGD